MLHSGGGIGGLFLAVALSRYSDIQVDLYEAAERFREIGAGVMIWSRTWEILTSLGLAPDFARVAHAVPDGSTGVGFDFRKSDQPEEGFSFYRFTLPYGCIRFHRAQFLDVLVDHLPCGVAHFGKRLRAYSDEGHGSPIELRFTDGTTEVCDLLVGCDGIKSTIRAQMLEDQVNIGLQEPVKCSEPVWTGTIAYRGLIPVDRLIKPDGTEHRTIATPMMYCGKNKHVVSYSISRGSVVNVVAFASKPEKAASTFEGSWVTDCSRDEMLSCYADWEPEVTELLKSIENPTRWAIHQLCPLSAYVTERVALLGDAAHAMSPHHGAGAGQAIEDAFVLARILGDPHTTLERIPHALLAYQHVRLPMANLVLCSSAECGRLYEFNGAFEGRDDFWMLGEVIGQQWGWLNGTTPEGNVERALRYTESDIKA
ncbi:FAD/NAD-P-binding domain-containing protein [Amylocystis lapponica]|nr:FAD/NAD-P-binding domain-containing protein [Amylocystis lapponica]